MFDRVRVGKSISCFCTNNEEGEVHVAFYDGKGGNTTISYLTFLYNTTRCVVEDTGVIFAGLASNVQIFPKTPK